MKIGFSNLMMINTRREPSAGPIAARVTGQPLSVAALNTDDPQTKRLKKQKEAFEALASLPSPKESAMQNASQKVGFLKQRLESLKAMMRFASPEQLKAMASELKSIAREMGAAARQLSGAGGGAGAGPTTTPTVNAAQSGHASVSVPLDANAQSEVSSVESDINAANATLESAEATTTEEPTSDSEQLEAQEQERKESLEPSDVLTQAPSFAPPGAERTPTISASEHALRSILTDAKKAFQEAVSELKIYLHEEQKEARRELKQAEEEMDKVDHSLAKAESQALYSTLGQLLPTSTANVATAAVSIDIKV
ncbi:MULTISPECIES: hypothetical protein [unclassified Halomonas]|uniref:hypothetical protein n=1 Tax=unclassified Halomonas TaxID=2609666 RepID=UPI00207673C6|nr:MULTISPECIES: hypothetical protein [unclassified Halomonas]